MGTARALAEPGQVSYHGQDDAEDGDEEERHEDVAHQGVIGGSGGGGCGGVTHCLGQGWSLHQGEDLLGAFPSHTHAQETDQPLIFNTLRAGD